MWEETGPKEVVLPDNITLTRREKLVDGDGKEHDVSPDHVKALKLVLREILRQELADIFELSNFVTMTGLAEQRMFNAVSHVVKQHVTLSLQNEVDKALRNVFDVYKQVNEQEIKATREQCVQIMSNFKSSLASGINSIHLS